MDALHIGLGAVEADDSGFPVVEGDVIPSQVQDFLLACSVLYGQEDGKGQVVLGPALGRRLEQLVHLVGVHERLALMLLFAQVANPGDFILVDATQLKSLGKDLFQDEQATVCQGLGLSLGQVRPVVQYVGGPDGCHEGLGPLLFKRFQEGQIPLCRGRAEVAFLFPAPPFLFAHLGHVAEGLALALFARLPLLRQQPVVQNDSKLVCFLLRQVAPSERGVILLPARVRVEILHNVAFPIFARTRRNSDCCHWLVSTEHSPVNFLFGCQ